MAYTSLRAHLATQSCHTYLLIMSILLPCLTTGSIISNPYLGRVAHNAAMHAYYSHTYCYSTSGSSTSCPYLAIDRVTYSTVMHAYCWYTLLFSSDTS